MIRDFTNNKKYALVLFIITIVFIIACLLSSCSMPTQDAQGKTWEHVILAVDTCGTPVSNTSELWKYDYYYKGIHYIVFNSRNTTANVIVNFTQDSIELVKAKREDQYWKNK